MLEVLEGINTIKKIATKFKKLEEKMSLAFDKSTVVKEYKVEIKELKKSKDLISKKLGETLVDKEYLEGKLVSVVSSKKRKVLLVTRLNISINKSSVYDKPKKPFSTSKEINGLSHSLSLQNIFHIDY